MRGKHRMPRSPHGPRKLWLHWQRRTRAVPRPRPVKVRPGGRDGLVVSGAMAVTLGAVGLAAVLTPGGARIAPTLAEPPAPAAPAPEPQVTVFVPPAEYEFPIAVQEAPAPEPVVRWVVEREPLVVPVERPRGQHWEPRVDHSSDRDERQDRPRVAYKERARDDRPRAEHGERDGKPRGEREHGGRDGHEREGRDRGERGDSGGRKGGDGGKSHDGGSGHGGKGRGQ